MAPTAPTNAPHVLTRPPVLARQGSAGRKLAICILSRYKAATTQATGIRQLGIVVSVAADIWGLSHRLYRPHAPCSTRMQLVAVLMIPVRSELPAAGPGAGACAITLTGLLNSPNAATSRQTTGRDTQYVPAICADGRVLCSQALVVGYQSHTDAT